MVPKYNATMELIQICVNFNCMLDNTSIIHIKDCAKFYNMLVLVVQYLSNIITHILSLRVKSYKPVLLENFAITVNCIFNMCLSVNRPKRKMDNISLIVNMVKKNAMQIKYMPAPLRLLVT